ncbi:hypothetical protein K466DRAFT_186580 [Polyporus arcularius HHB13444]|uniref:Uncharacterized protein n=1 Tax=Polyporus arcularius HHB13444 TaxID=1314778 RepID=A0A5C3P9A0_9APHY|nr:hypothetical protein K466DRAFT_186580 [Polyporus arcularius HHB13444]
MGFVQDLGASLLVRRMRAFERPYPLVEDSAFIWIYASTNTSPSHSESRHRDSCIVDVARRRNYICTRIRRSLCHSRTQLLQWRVGDPLTRTGWVLRPTVLAPARLGAGLSDRTALRQRHRDSVRIHLNHAYPSSSASHLDTYVVRAWTVHDYCGSRGRQLPGSQRTRMHTGAGESTHPNISAPHAHAHAAATPPRFIYVSLPCMTHPDIRIRVAFLKLEAEVLALHIWIQSE